MAVFKCSPPEKRCKIKDLKSINMLSNIKLGDDAGYWFKSL